MKLEHFSHATCADHARVCLFVHGVPMAAALFGMSNHSDSRQRHLAEMHTSSLNLLTSQHCACDTPGRVSYVCMHLRHVLPCSFRRRSSFELHLSTERYMLQWSKAVPCVGTPQGRRWPSGRGLSKLTRLMLVAVVVEERWLLLPAKTRRGGRLASGCRQPPPRSSSSS